MVGGMVCRRRITRAVPIVRRRVMQRDMEAEALEPDLEEIGYPGSLDA